MALTGVGTDTYVTEAALSAYATARGVTISGDTEQLLLKAMDWLEYQPFLGSKYDINQALEFPRYPDDVSYPYGPNYPYGEVPAKIEKAQIVAALLIDGGADLLANIGRATKREKVDVIEVEYMGNAGETTRYPELSMLIRDFVAGAGNVQVNRG
jgi:hypothetical protein